MQISMLRWCINQVIRTINVIKNKFTNLHFYVKIFYHLFIIKVISSSNISACIFLKIFFMFEYKCVHVFSKTKCIFKYKCMHIY